MSLVCPMVVPLMITLSTVKVVSVPKLVTLPCAAVANVPVNVPVTVRLSAIVVSEVVCPIEIGTPEFAVPIAIPPVVSVVSISISSVASISRVVALKSIAPSTVSEPSMSVLSKFATPSISIFPDISSVGAASVPVIVIFLPPEISLFESAIIALLATMPLCSRAISN